MINPVAKSIISKPASFEKKLNADQQSSIFGCQATTEMLKSTTKMANGAVKRSFTLHI